MGRTVEDFAEAFGRDPGASGFVLDFDGTLSTVVGRPASAAALPGVPRLLERLAARYRVVALLSGRRARDLHALVGAEGVRYVGLYGAEEFSGGRLVQPESAETWRGMASRLARDAEALILAEGLSGCEVEYKDLAVSVHYRNAADPGAEEAILTWAEAGAARRGFRWGAGRKVVELTPEGISKGSALERVVREEGLRRLVAAGDDYSDISALRAAGELLGNDALRIGVRSQEEPEDLASHSDVLVPSPERAVALLARFA